MKIFPLPSSEDEQDVEFRNYNSESPESLFRPWSPQGSPEDRLPVASAGQEFESEGTQVEDESRVCLGAAKMQAVGLQHYNGIVNNGEVNDSYGQENTSLCVYAWSVLYVCDRRNVCHNRLIITGGMCAKENACSVRSSDWNHQNSSRQRKEACQLHT